MAKRANRNSAATGTSLEDEVAMRLIAVASILCIAAACSEPLPEGEPAAVIDMSAATGVADLELAGVAVEGETGRRFVLGSNTGIWELDGSTATPIVPMSAMPDPQVEVRLPFTDIASIGDSKLALTAIGDGFILDLAANTLTLHFCYEPGFVEPWPESQEQRTDAVAYDSGAGQIIAQPRTFGVESGDINASQIAYYDAETGVDLQWYDVPTSFEAGGMTVMPEVGLVVSNGTGLHTFDGALIGLDRLERFGVSSIDGLAYDASTDTLLVIDGGTSRLVEIAASDLGL